MHRSAARLEIPRPRVTEYNAITVGPVVAQGEAGPPSGSPGQYDVVFVLGVPGVSGQAISGSEGSRGRERYVP